VDEIHELADAFDTMLARLDRAFQAQRRFAANASHELRTPLSTTQTMLEVTRRNKEPSRAELLRLVERVDEVNRRNIETVEALLDLAEIEQSTIGREPVRLDRVAQQNVELVEAERAESDIEVVTRLDPVTTTGDPVLIRQAIANLAFNAVRHNVDGGRIEITTGSEDHGGAFIRISNTGSVLSTEQVAALTEPFVRGAGRISSRGHGLGLAIVQTVADAHGGSLLLEPRAGGGLTVTLVLSPH
jgi:two-component system sensor histidine kinase VanS